MRAACPTPCRAPRSPARRAHVSFAVPSFGFARTGRSRGRWASGRGGAAVKGRGWRRPPLLRLFASASAVAPFAHLNHPRRGVSRTAPPRRYSPPTGVEGGGDVRHRRGETREIPRREGIREREREGGASARGFRSPLDDDNLIVPRYDRVTRIKIRLILSGLEFSISKRKKNHIFKR